MHIYYIYVYILHITHPHTTHTHTHKTYRVPSLRWDRYVFQKLRKVITTTRRAQNSKPTFHENRHSDVNSFNLRPRKYLEKLFLSFLTELGENPHYENTHTHTHTERPLR